MYSRTLVFFFWFLLGADDFIGLGLGGMGYSRMSYKKIIPNCKFIRNQFQTRIFKNKHFASCNV